MFELIRMTIREQKEETRRKVPGKERGSESEEDGGGGSLMTQWNIAASSFAL